MLRRLAPNIPLVPVYAVIVIDFYHQRTVDQNVIAGFAQYLLLTLSTRLPQSTISVGALSSLRDCADVPALALVDEPDPRPAARYKGLEVGGRS